MTNVIYFYDIAHFDLFSIHLYIKSLKVIRQKIIICIKSFIDRFWWNLFHSPWFSIPKQIKMKNKSFYIWITIFKLQGHLKVISRSNLKSGKKCPLTPQNIHIGYGWHFRNFCVSPSPLSDVYNFWQWSSLILPSTVVKTFHIMQKTLQLY